MLSLFQFSQNDLKKDSDPDHDDSDTEKEEKNSYQSLSRSNSAVQRQLMKVRAMKGLNYTCRMVHNHQLGAWVM